MASLNRPIHRIQSPIQNPLTTENLRRVSVGNNKWLMQYPGSPIVSDIGQQIGATVSDPFGFKATIDGLQTDIKQGIPTFLVGAAVLVVGLILIWSGVQAFILPTAGKIAGAALKVAT